MFPQETPEPNCSEGSPMSRRRFIASAAAMGFAAPLVVPRFVLGGEGRQAPSDTLRIAAIGIGGMGRYYLAGCKGERVVALCDLDHRYAAPVFETYPSAERYHDFRRMLDKEANRFDALVIATPDHTHAILLMAALKLEKHIYCAKPIAHSIAEVRRIRQAVSAAKGLVTKASVQSSATEAARSTSELLASGVIGPVRGLHIWCDHPAYPCSLVRPKEPQTPPAGMDWDSWIGPAAHRPYHSAYHPANWRPWWDFGTGTVGDMGCHTLHVFFRELQLGAPGLVYGSASTRHEGFFRPVSTPECQSHANTVTWEFPARGSQPPLSVYWYDGGMKPHRPVELEPSLGMPHSGLLFVGEKGKLMANYCGGNPFRRGGAPRGPRGGLLLPEKKFGDVQDPPKTLPRVEDHYGEWTRACKAGVPTICPIEFACELTEMALLGTLALRTGRVLQWDAEQMRVTNYEQANAHVDPPYRAGWSL